MGIQNFTGGGFYGKVGVHVGQRLYDKFIIRAWVKGTNPRTPRQIKWRSFFGTASKRSAAALNVNPHSGIFRRTDCPVMGQRIESAVALERAGAEFLDLYPLFPADYNPPLQGSGVSRQAETETTVTLALSGSLPSVERRLGAIVAFYDALADTWEVDFTSGTFYPTAGGGVAVLRNAWYGRWNESTNIVIVSDDDKDRSWETYWQKMTPVMGSPVVERAFDFTISSFHRTGRNFVLEFNEDFVTNTQTLGAVTVRAVVAGAWSEIVLENPALVQNGSKFALKFSAPGTTGETIWAFPSGASVNFASVNVYAEGLHLTATNQNVSVVSTDLTRTLSEIISPSYDATIEDGGGMLYLEGDFIETASPSLNFFNANKAAYISAAANLPLSYTIHDDGGSASASFSEFIEYIDIPGYDFDFQFNVVFPAERQGEIEAMSSPKIQTLSPAFISVSLSGVAYRWSLERFIGVNVEI